MKIWKIILLPILFSLAIASKAVTYADTYEYRFASDGEYLSIEQSVVGAIETHTIQPGETLLDIARDFGLGFNEIEILYPEVDPWVPKAGTELVIPTKWILPPSLFQQVVINLPELRLYRFFPHLGLVKTYPIGIGDIGWETPEGICEVVNHATHPTWMVPRSLRKKYKAAQIPPGPDNPLGKYWIGLSRRGYGIHGTNFPWGVGRLVSHGCIRLYPEHIAQLYKEVLIGTLVEIIYEPVKIGINDEEIYVEVHPDPYGKIGDIHQFTFDRLRALGLWNYISIEKVNEALESQNGMPLQVGTIRQRS